MYAFQSFQKEIRFKDLCEAASYCSLCDRLSNRTKVLSESNGNLWSKVLFIAEAPGRLGADRTGIPLFGDKTGDNFESLLGNIGWKREDVFITNAILCNPRDDKGTNGTPKPQEISNCTPYLEMTIELVQPEVIITLGSIALTALRNIALHQYNLKNHVGQTVRWRDRILIPLYHPGPRARVHRSYPKQTSDFISLAKFVDPRKGIKNRKRIRSQKLRDKSNSKHPTDFQKLICAIVNSLGKMTYFKLTKLLYLIDLNALINIGHSITNEVYLRQQEGPWPPALKNAIPPLEGYDINLSFRGKIPVIEPGPSPRIDIDFDDKALETIEEVLERFGHLDNRGVKVAVYKTKPMNYILKQEKLGRDMRKTPIIYKNMTAQEHDKAK